MVKYTDAHMEEKEIHTGSEGGPSGTVVLSNKLQGTGEASGAEHFGAFLCTPLP
jgi:hypothetical protein